MGRKRRAFSTEFKLEAVRRAGERRERGTALAVIARELGITADLLRRWTRELGDASPQAVASRQDLEAENRRLRRENEVLRQERDFARNVAAYVAKEHR